MYAYDIKYLGTRLGVPEVKYHRVRCPKKSTVMAIQALEVREGDSIEVLTISLVSG